MGHSRDLQVSYHHNVAIESHHFGHGHPMKPWRLTLTNNLVDAYGLAQYMDTYVTRSATFDEIKEFHREDYLEFLQRVTPAKQDKFLIEISKFNIGEDCPIFDGMWDYSSLYAGASLDAARKLVNGQSDIAINWSGGLHHAKRSEASGFCYVNDIVLAILQLLRIHPRVLYIDIDVHHGDGVEQAFYSTDRVMTLSFHKYDKDNFFPCTGNYDEIGVGAGKHHSLNVPLKDGIEDSQYTTLFKEIVERVMLTYKPSVVVLQCGADSLGCDRLGCFNLNIKAHGECVQIVKDFGLPTLVLGGGGYTPRNVSRLWAYETSVCVGAEVTNELPPHTNFKEYFSPDYTLHPPLSREARYENKNTRRTLDLVKTKIFEQLRYINGAPSVQMQEIPPDIGGIQEVVEQRIAEEEALKEKSRRKAEKASGRVGELY
ncbi:hypothetical protein BGX38DRAFT_1087671 [Terfezia claveryi]|nr:hypothetical protein BGX38DRAFT_1087671 [Terfezia claveryi]